jgi:protein TonB
MNANTEAGERFALTLAGSLILHFALVFGLQIRPQITPHSSSVILQARLVDAALDAPHPPRTPPDPQAMKLLSEDIPLPVPQAASEPVSQQEAAAPSAAPEEKATSLPIVEVPLIEDPTYYKASEVDVHPSALQVIQPAYPDEATSANVAGSVVLLLLLDESGKVQDISVEEASPPGYFEKSALEAFRNARFSPAQRQGRVVKSRMRIKVLYELAGRNNPVDKAK